MFADDVPAYTIDLSVSEPQRWAEVIAREATATGRIVGEASASFERVPELLRWGFALLYQASGRLLPLGDRVVGAGHRRVGGNGHHPQLRL
jgi:hypothetical protein